MACPVSPDLMDEDYQYIMFEFNMNYTVEGVRHGYLKHKEEKNKIPTDELMAELGYSDEDVLNREV